MGYFHHYANVAWNLLKLLYYVLEALFLSLYPKSLRYKDVAGETVLITGGGSGIGRLLSVRFARRGCRIVVWDLNLEAAKETAELVKQETGAECFAYHCDVSKPQNVYECAARVKREAGKVDILVNNAGIVTGKKLMDIPDHMIVKTFEVNAISHFWTCKAFVPDMKATRHGHLVSIASMAGLSGVARLTDYCASKFAAVGFEESLKLELTAEGYGDCIHSTVVCPYFINTGMFDGAKPGLFSMMTPEYVADEIVSAVLVNQEMVLLPKIFNFLIFLKSFVSPKVVHEALTQMSITSSMSDFSGRSHGDGKLKNKIFDDHVHNNNNNTEIEIAKIKGL